ncbi:MAG TPA: hypothetical protein VFH56_05140 [Acidimicrobiales bacterium]|nr:hypothetical protein [Acidimicrobiales bacterium]
MADFTYNIAKGRVAELYNRVKTGDPAAARLYIIPVAAGAVTDATLKDCADFGAVITAGVTELTTGGWARKTLAAADLAAMAPDNTNDRMPLDTGDQTWTAVTAGTTSSTDLIFCYASVATPTNAQLVPLTQHDFAATPDGSDITATIADFFRAS